MKNCLVRWLCQHFSSDSFQTYSVFISMSVFTSFKMRNIGTISPEFFSIKFDKINNFHLFKRFHNFRLNLSKLVKCVYISITRTLLKMMNIVAINLLWSFTEFQSIVKCSFFIQFTVFIHFFFKLLQCFHINEYSTPIVNEQRKNKFRIISPWSWEKYEITLTRWSRFFKTYTVLFH